jgi:hypothetical protein
MTATFFADGGLRPLTNDGQPDCTHLLLGGGGGGGLDGVLRLWNLELVRMLADRQRVIIIIIKSYS